MGKLNIGKAIKAGLAGYQLDQEDQKLELLKIKNKEDRILRAAELGIKKQQADSMKRNSLTTQLAGAMGLFKSFVAGKEDIKPAQRKSMVDFFSKAGFDVSPFFDPVENKDGVVTNFTVSTADSIQKAFDNHIAEEKSKTDEINANAKMIQAHVAKRKAENGDSVEDSMDYFFKTNETINDPKKSWKEKWGAIVKAEAELSTAKALDETVEITKDGVFVRKGKNANMGKPTKNILEKELNELYEEKLSYNKAIETEFLPLLTYKGKIKNFTLSMIEKLDPKALDKNDRLFLEKASVFKANLGRMFDAYRTRVTGAQAGMQELKYLEDRIMNAEMSVSQYKGIKRDLDETINKHIRLKRMLLREGMSEKATMDKMNDIILSRKDPSVSIGERTRRGNELEEMFLSKGQSAARAKDSTWKILKTEGFF